MKNPSSKLFEELLRMSRDTFVWIRQDGVKVHYLVDFGIGYVEPEETEVYNESYFEDYVIKANTPIGKALNKARVDFTNKNYQGDWLCDVGVGGLAFCKEMNCAGFDINPTAVEKLKEFNLYMNPYEWDFDCLTLWDVVEHITDPSDLFANVNQVILSTPIYKDFDSTISSKHFKPNEHVWYFTEKGLIKFMSLLGFYLDDSSDIETKIGRESIGSYSFKRYSR